MLRLIEIGLLLFAPRGKGGKKANTAWTVFDAARLFMDLRRR
jgi:hypothetical protein